MADKDVPLTGKAVFDRELYGGGADKLEGYDVVLDDEEQDERERALAE